MEIKSLYEGMDVYILSLEEYASENRFYAEELESGYVDKTVKLKIDASGLENYEVIDLFLNQLKETVLLEAYLLNSEKNSTKFAFNYIVKSFLLYPQVNVETNDLGLPYIESEILVVSVKVSIKIEGN